MGKIAETDLILNKDGSVYHLNLLPHHIADTIIAVGDPNRVDQVSQHFTDIEFEMNKREFITHTGKFNNKRITVISTGIGTDNIEIFLTELDALVNVDLKTREPKTKKKKLRIIRVGTSGAIQEDIPTGTFIASDYAIGFDNLMQFYPLPQTDYEKMLAQNIQQHTQLSFTPYLVKGSESLLQTFSSAHGFRIGNTITAPGFYAPQGRNVRIETKYPKLLEELTYFHHAESNFWLTNFEMETAGYYALGRMLQHECISLNAIIANRVNNQFAKNAHQLVDDLIVKTLSLL
ncbi:MAG: nucleoside phosphorylase [Cyclobacteriaceae bacterium]|jgi:uridine phosphorylase|nr:nucleoside phosphorylase [Cyclobacteriaceae bacterium]